MAKSYAFALVVITALMTLMIGRLRIGLWNESPRDELVLEGEPELEVVIPGGVHGDLATSAMTLNSIRPLLAALPGLHTMATIPLVHYAAPTW